MKGTFLLRRSALVILMGSMFAMGLVAQRSVSPGMLTSFFDGNSGTFVPEWQADGKSSAKYSVNTLYDAPVFKGAQYDSDIRNLPFQDIVVPISSTERLRILSQNTENRSDISTSMFRESMKESGLKVEEWYPAQHVIAGPIEIRRGQYFQHLHIYPILIHANGDQMRKAMTINYSLGRERISSSERKSSGARKAYKNESVLKTGTWYKIAVTSDGIYKLDRSYLSNLGLNVNSLDPRKIRIHGNGGGMLPQEAGLYPYDDLEENSIQVVGENDGSLDNNDYVLFYGQGPHRWHYSNRLNRYVHFQNTYSDTTFYFLSVGSQNGKRITNAISAGAATFTPNSTDKYTFHELEKQNPLLSGRVWLGETFDLTTTQNYNFATSRLLSGSNVTVSTRVTARSHGSSSQFSVRENGTTYATLQPRSTVATYGSYYYRGAAGTFDIPASSITDGNANLEFIFSKSQTSAVGYLDYIEVEYEQRLDAGNLSTWYFNARENTGPGAVFDYQISGGSSGYTIWNITDPVNVQKQAMTYSGGKMNFDVAADSARHFVAFNGIFKTPAKAVKISNQNLHGKAQADYIIITPTEFKSGADKLANFHRNTTGLSVHVVELHQIYNEYSSGQQDPTAIRDFMKMFYDRANNGAGTPPQYLLLLGDGSYDYKYLATAAGSNKVPTYQSRNSQLPTTSYISDDYYGFLDNGEGFWGEDAAHETGEILPVFLAEGDTVRTHHGLDISIGRIPVGTAQEANDMAQKVIDYANSSNGFGPWRNLVVLVADHKDDEGSIHVGQADSYTSRIKNHDPCANVNKIYMDNYNMESTASGDRFPEGKEALLRSLDEGSLIVNYTGHGGEVGWSNASILDISDINQIDNDVRLPAYITATCEFGRWDDPARRSGAEHMFVRAEGGSIAMLTTVRVVYSSPNYTLNQNFYEEVFTYDNTNQRMPTIGEVFMRTKNASWGGTLNNRNFSLLGDPGLTLSYPENKAVVTKINGQMVVDSIVDTLAALTLVTIEGEVRDNLDNLMPTFNGNLFVTVFDKPAQFTTRRSSFIFTWQKNKVFKGTASVSNGKFNFQFVIPIDISYEDQLSSLNGKISLYFNNNEADGGGCNANLFIGGTDSSAISDDRGPMLDIYMNDAKFPEGGMVGPNPTLVAEIFDENGLNTVGTGIGHELTAVIDENEEKVIVLNDYYEANKNTYQEGTIEYPFKDLDVGEHSLKVKVWDVANNSSESQLTFLVADDAKFALGHVLNYPNPFTTSTKFFVEHNRDGRLLDVQVRIYTVSGRLVKTLEDSFFADGNLYCDLEWDGLDEYGDALGRGVYVYQVRVEDQDTGDRVTKFEKLVVLR